MGEGADAQENEEQVWDEDDEALDGEERGRLAHGFLYQGNPICWSFPNLHDFAAVSA